MDSNHRKLSSSSSHCDPSTDKQTSMMVSAMIQRHAVSAAAFAAIRTGDVAALASLPTREVRPLLASLARIAFTEGTTDNAADWIGKRKQLISLVCGYEELTPILALLSVNFQELEIDIRREQQHRAKVGYNPQDSPLLSQLKDGLAMEFERVEGIRSLRLLLAELLSVSSVAQAQQGKGAKSNSYRKSDLFDSDVFLDEICDTLVVACAELPNTVIINEVVEVLLGTQNGPVIICRLVANFPHSFHAVCSSLILKGSIQDEDSLESRTRLITLQMLCRMNPHETSSIRGQAAQLCRMPALTVALTLDLMRQRTTTTTIPPDVIIDDLVSFFIGFLLGTDEKCRQWFANFVKHGQKKMDAGSETCLTQLRALLLEATHGLTQALLSSAAETQSHRWETSIIQASTLLRFWCALRGVALIKLADEEIGAINALIMCRIPPSSVGAHFISLGLCTLLATPSLLAGTSASAGTTGASGSTSSNSGTSTSNSNINTATATSAADNERRIIDWLQWLVREEGFFGFASGSRESFGELLLLIAIHFHTNSTTSIGELVCATLGMKLTLRPVGLNRIKLIFAQEVFTDQVIASYAVKVPVTHRLNASMSGFLPVNCIYNLLKSRSFSKHKVPIKRWILLQICSSCAPIHHSLPSLIRTFVDSSIIPSSKTSPQLTNEPIDPVDIARIFRYKVYTVDISVGGGGDGDPSKRSSSDNKGFSPMDVDGVDDTGKVDVTQRPVCVLTSQLLLLYYLLYYDQLRLSHMKSLVASNRKVLKYPADLIGSIPVFYLLQEARSDETKYGALFPNFLHLISNHYPHLCLVEDWLAAERRYALSSSVAASGNGDGVQFHSNSNSKFLRACISGLEKAFKRLQKPPMTNIKDSAAAVAAVAAKVNSFSKLEMCMDHVLSLPMRHLWPVSVLFVEHLSLFLDLDCPESLLNKMAKCWWRLNSIFPRCLWIKTVNAVRPADDRASGPFSSLKRVDLKWTEIVEDPLHVLRCDRRVLHCPQMMEITLHILQGCLVASRTYLSQHLMEKPPSGPNIPKGANEEAEGEIREELRIALCVAQESAAIQILLECCKENDQFLSSVTKVSKELPLPGSERSSSPPQSDRDSSATLARRIGLVRSLICSHLHQIFINDTNLAKLVHFQGYHSDLLPVTVRLIPSMHICVDFIPEMLSQPCWRKQQFAIELISHLSVQYPVVKSLNVARLCFNVCATLMGLLPAEKRGDFFAPVVPALGRMVRAFPVLRDECVALLVQLAQVTISRLAFTSPYFTYTRAALQKFPIEPDDHFTTEDYRRYFSSLPKCDPLLLAIESTFSEVIRAVPPRQWAIKGSS